MRNKILLILTLIPLGYGCLADTTTIPNPAESVLISQSVSPTPSDIPTTLISPNSSITPNATLTPDINATPNSQATPDTSITPTVTSTPGPSISPTPSPFIDYVNSYSMYAKCLPIDKDFKAKLDYPIDLAVTKDGKKVYVLNLRRNLNSFGYENGLKDVNPDGTNTLNRQFIYEIKEDKSITALKVNDEYPFSCQLSEEIEIDKDGNLFVSKPDIDLTLKYNPYLAQNIYKITPDKQMSLYKKIDLGIPDPSGSARPDPRILTNLHLTEKNELFYLLRSNDVESYDRLSQIDINKNIKDILYYHLKYNGNMRDFAIYKNQIYTSLFKFDIKERENIGDSLADFLLNRNSNNVEQIYNKEIGIVYGQNVPIKKDIRTIIDKLGNVYISDNESNVIWKVISDKEIIKFAGSGQAGYKDGLSQEAQLNNPTTMTFDGEGNMFVADSGNNAIRKITPAGIVSTFYKEN